MKLKISKLILYLMFLFPISTVISDIPIIGSIVNKMIFGFIVISLAYGIFKTKLSKKSVLILVLLVGIYIYDSIVTVWPLYNLNEFFYIGTWVLFMTYITSNYELFKKELINSVQPMRWMIIVWEFIVSISLVFPSCYPEGYFLSLAGSTHRMDSSAMMILATILIMYRYTKYSKRVLLLLVVPSVAIVLSGARTYIVLLCLVLTVFYYYANIKHTWRFYFTIIPITILVIAVIFSTSAMQQRIDIMQEQTEYFDSLGYNKLTSVTSGRSEFWVIDLMQYWKSPVMNRIFGNGFNFVRHVNLVYYMAEIWAHNDFINILCCNGIVGLYLYFKVYFDLAKKEKKKLREDNKKTILLLLIFHLTSMFNAMFNMLYTYFAATLAVPVFLVAIMDKEILPDRKDKRNLSC